MTIYAKRMYTRNIRSSIMMSILFVLAFSSYVEMVLSLPADTSQWPSFPRRNIAALARDGYFKNSPNGFKRSISTLAKNGQLPTFSSRYDENDKNEQEEEETQEKRNVASLARLRSYADIKRNIQALARDGYRAGRGQYNPQSEKRNLASIMRSGGRVFKKNDAYEDEYYLPFYQNSIPPLSEVDGPFDSNELYDLQQSINPDMFPPLSQVFKRDIIGSPSPMDYMTNYRTIDDNWFPKRGVAGFPAHGLYRPVYVDSLNNRAKRYIMSIPDTIDKNDVGNTEDNIDENGDKRSVDEETNERQNFVKRHIGSLARLGLLPSFRFSGGRYSRSGRARLLLPSQELYRKHSHDENFGIREYISSSKVEPAVDPDDADIPPAAVPPHSHPTGRILRRPLNNDLPSIASPSLPSTTKYIDATSNNTWQPHTKENPKFYYFRSLKVPYHNSGKRYLLLPAVDNILLRKNYPNSSLPSRRKNQ